MRCDHLALMRQKPTDRDSRGNASKSERWSTAECDVASWDRDLQSFVIVVILIFRLSACTGTVAISRFDPYMDNSLSASSFFCARRLLGVRGSEDWIGPHIEMENEVKTVSKG
jgi:hypothetical protein